MTAFREILAAKSRIPEKHVILKREAFADGWASKPAEDIALGLRRISDNDVQTARAEAAKYAIGMHSDQDGQIESFNDALMRWAIVAGTCDANDVGVPAGTFDGSEENVRNALTSKSIRYIWDEMERFHIETSPVVPSATDEEIVLFANRLLQGPLPVLMSPGALNRTRKLLGFLVQQFAEVEGIPEIIDEELSSQLDNYEMKNE